MSHKHLLHIYNKQHLLCTSRNSNESLAILC